MATRTPDRRRHPPYTLISILRHQRSAIRPQKEKGNRIGKVLDDTESSGAHTSSAIGRLQARMRVYEEHIAAVGSGEVGRLVPDKDETARGLALRIGRAARRANKPVKTWIDKNTVYFEPVS